MRAAFERIEAEGPTSWKYHIRRARSFPFEWHYHPTHELTLIVRGSGRRFVGDSIEPYAAGDLVLVGPNLPHTWHSARRSEPSAKERAPEEAVVAHFVTDFLGPALWTRPEFGLVADLLQRAGRGLAFPTAVSEAVAGDLRHICRRSPDERTVALLGILCTLARSPARSLADRGYRPDLDGVARDRIDTACRHISEHFAEPLSRTSVADTVALSPAAFSRIFRRSTGRSFISYLTGVRVSAARQLLIDTEANVAYVASQCGFRNLSNFNRRFRALTGLSPREFRVAYHSRRTTSARA